ncbi:MAG: hypothetical protein GTO54_09925 [Nitrososphaeria archaeon]|nr:hypothetical protein [Nitrososphaeria archaeon]
MLTRKSTQFGRPEESITSAKCEKLSQVALAYLQPHQNLPPFWRIDVVDTIGRVPSRLR